MNREIRLGGITLVLSLVASMAVAAGAQAGNFSAAQYPATLAGSQTEGPHTLTTPRWGVKCAKASFAGILKEASPTLTVSPEYSECGSTLTVFKVYVVAATTIKTNGCTYTYHDETTDSGTVSTGSTTINCPAGKQIEYEFLDVVAGESHIGSHVLCTLGVGPQGPLSGITYTDKSESKIDDVQIGTSLNVSVNIVFGGAGACGPVAGTTYKGSTTQTAKNSKGEAISLKAG